MNLEILEKPNRSQSTQNNKASQHKALDFSHQSCQNKIKNKNIFWHKNQENQHIEADFLFPRKPKGSEMVIEEIASESETRDSSAQNTRPFPVSVQPYVSRLVVEETREAVFSVPDTTHEETESVVVPCSKMEQKQNPGPKNKGGRPKIAPERQKNTAAHYLKVYLKYPTEHDKDRIRNIARGINKANDMRFARMIRIANTESEAMQMVMADRRARAEYERQYRVWLRRKIKADKKLEDQTFRATVKTICRAIKHGKPIRNDEQ